MKEVKNLWSDAILQESEVLPPFTILQQQAKYFNEMTKNVLVAVAESKNGNLILDSEGTKPILLHRLLITAPILGGYNFELVRVKLDKALPYPVEIYAPLTEQRYEANNPQEVEQVLENIFTGAKTISVIQNLLAQSSFETAR